MSGEHGGQTPQRLAGAHPRRHFTITVDGQPVRVVPGQTLGAVLTAAGLRSWRRTRFEGRQRGLFCGVGICFDCLVTVNGTPSVRACLAEAKPGDVVETHRYEP